MKTGQVPYDELTGLPLELKLVGDAIKEWLMFMRKLQVFHEVLVGYLDKSGLKAIGARWVYTNSCDAASTFIRAMLVAQETKRVSELTPEDTSSTFEEKVLGFCDISGAHFHSLARRTIVIKVPREDDECTSCCAVLDKAMKGTKDVAQCFDFASENAMTAMGYDTGKFSLLSVSFERS